MKIEEIWKDIPNYEGLYQVSNIGRVRSYDRNIIYISKTGKVCKRLLPGRIMIARVGDDGYYSVELYKNKSSKRIKIHRLVALTFIPNPNNFPCINHKDETRTNNNVENLEWCTYLYNNNYGTHPQKISNTLKGVKKSAEHIRKMSESQRGKIISEKTRQKMSENNRGVNNPNYGRHHSEETKQKIREARLRRSKKVI